MSTHTKERAVKAKAPLSAVAVTRRRDRIVARAIKEGRITKSERAFYRQNLDANPEATLRVLASLPPSASVASSQQVAVEEVVWPGGPVLRRQPDDDRRPEADEGFAGFTASAKKTGLL
jgi:hypothetical protein